MLFLIRNRYTKEFEGVVTATEDMLFWVVDAYADPLALEYKPLKVKGVSELTHDGEWFVFEIPNGYESIQLVLITE